MADNWAFLYAQKIAKKLKCPLHVCKDGLRQDVVQECQQLSISFHLLTGAAPTVLPPLLKSLRAGGLVTDFSPLRPHTQDLASVLAALPSDVAVCQVDAHNVVPCWEASTKQEYAAKTLRPRLLSHLPEFLTHFPTVEPHPFPPLVKLKNVLQCEMCAGHISAQRCVLTALQQAAKHRQAVEAYMEQVVIRKELTDNFCFYNPNYDQIDGGSVTIHVPQDSEKTSWFYIFLSLGIALYTSTSNSLYCYDASQPSMFACKVSEKTMDINNYTWEMNTCLQCRPSTSGHDNHENVMFQKVLVRDGLMHNFLRMYWAKKILEWTSSPEEALDIAIFLNDHYQLDGCDPNGFVGKWLPHKGNNTMLA
ncbi:phr [Cordylochernes scorpioides]|uniref:Phr n=1 Tax=Cordylochernes scorpioides TaxID=51811 RepID=A0ABY6KWG1_9ARAC|nr:phr [Cordylochernes scorpioides]